MALWCVLVCAVAAVCAAEKPWMDAGMCGRVLCCLVLMGVQVCLPASVLRLSSDR